MVQGRKVRILLVALAAVAAALVAFGFGGNREAQPPVQLAMVSPLTGPLSFVGKDDAEGALAAVKEVNRLGGVKGRKIAIDVFDDGSNPSQGVIHMQKIAADSKYVGVVGSGFSSVGLAVAPVVASGKIPYISMASSVAQVTPAKPYYYMTTATSRLFAYAMAFELRKRGIKSIAIMADNGGFGREGLRNVKELAGRFGFNIVEEIVFPLTSTTFTAELSKVKGSGAQALWLWNATTLAVTITKEMRQLQLPQKLVLTGGNASVQYLEPACPEANGALIDTYLGPVAKFLPESNPSRPIGLKLDKLLGHPGSTFNYDGYTAIQMFKQAMTVGGFTRDAINTALETKMRGFVGPGGRYYYSPVNHSGLGLKSMVVSEIKNCKLEAVKGQSSLK